MAFALRCALIAATLSLSACATAPHLATGSVGPPRIVGADQQAIDQALVTIGKALDAADISAPAPLAGTTLDERAVQATFKGFDAALYAVDSLLDVGALKPGTPTALTIREAVLAVRHWLPVASAAQRAGNATSYAAAMQQAAAALAHIRNALGG